MEFFTCNKMVIANTFFKNQKCKLNTWKQPDVNGYQTDFILVKESFRNQVMKARMKTDGKDERIEGEKCQLENFYKAVRKDVKIN